MYLSIYLSIDPPTFSTNNGDSGDAGDAGDASDASDVGDSGDSGDSGDAGATFYNSGTHRKPAGTRGTRIRTILILIDCSFEVTSSTLSMYPSIYLSIY